MFSRADQPRDVLRRRRHRVQARRPIGILLIGVFVEHDREHRVVAVGRDFKIGRRHPQASCSQGDGDRHRENTDVESWSVGSSENGTQRGELVGAALDSTAGLINLIAVFVFEGRDKELEDLVRGVATTVETPIEIGKGDNHTARIIAGQVSSGKGIGEAIIFAIQKTRGSTDTKRRIVREAIASLKASGEHDWIIKRVADDATAKAEADRVMLGEPRQLECNAMRNLRR